MENNSQTEQKQKILKTLQKSKSVFILLPQNPNLDSTAAALALYLSFKEFGKNVIIGCPSEIKVELSRLVGIDKVTDKVGNRNLVISFAYQEDSIEKVSYNVEDQKFNLVIQPRSGFPPLNYDNIKFSYQGLEAELIFTVGVQKLENLGDIYEKEKQAFSQATIVNLDRSPVNAKFGKINIIDPKSVSLSNLVYQLIKDLELPFNADAASNILKGIEAQTQNLQSPLITAETFEIIAELMRSGARRSQLPFSSVQDQPPGMRQAGFPIPINPLTQNPGFSSPAISYPNPSQPGISPFQFGAQNPAPSKFPTGQLISSQELQIPQPRKKQAPALPVVNHNQDMNDPAEEEKPAKDFQRTDAADDSNQKKQPQEEWLKPKVYQGKTQI